MSEFRQVRETMVDLLQEVVVQVEHLKLCHDLEISAQAANPLSVQMKMCLLY